MTPAIDIVDGHGLSNETCHEFQPKKTKVLAIHLAVNGSLRVVHHLQDRAPQL